jgi:8-oxo-dGTP pyrophosphatase MutT (NUDIX family)
MKFKLDWDGKSYELEWHNETNFEEIGNLQSVLGFLFDKEGKLCIVKFRDKGHWALPGGHIEEYDKNIEDTLIREVREEADLEIRNIQRVGYLSGINLSTRNKEPNQLRCVALINEIKEQTIDPAEGYIPERKFIDIKDFDKYLGWGEDGEWQLKAALDILNN